MAAPLVQMTPTTPATTSRAAARKPTWLKVKAPGGPNYITLKQMMRDLKLHTVCEEAHCPNVGDCWEHKAATFMILGDVCTRNCAYCAVAHGTPTALDPDEPARLADAVARMDLRHVVITSVDRDDLPNGGAEIFAACIAEIRRRLPETSIEVLIPDFKGSDAALRLVVRAAPDILNHNLETIDRLYRIARPGGRYTRALELLRRAKEMNPDALTKSGIICGLGEEWDELLVAMRDLAAQGVDILTIGQYLRPSEQHLPIARWYTPDEFAGLKRLGHSARITQILNDEIMVSAVGQGALGIVCRSDDSRTKDLLITLDHEPTRIAVTAERGLLRALGGSCQVPVAGKAKLDSGVLTLKGLIASLDGVRVITDEISGPSGRAVDLGTELGEKLLRMGAGEILAEIAQHGAER